MIFRLFALEKTRILLYNKLLFCILERMVIDMKKYSEMSQCELNAEFESVKAQYEALNSLQLSLDMSRGKPGSENLDLSNSLLDLVNADNGQKNIDNIDCRNYGFMDGIREIKELFGEILGVPATQVIAGGNSSLTMMFDTIAQGMTHGLGDKPWAMVENRKFLCPAPGYDRHFGITEYFGFELITIPMNSNGPDMDMVEEYVKDESVKGIWCVPKYSNPDGITYSDEVVKRFAGLKPAAKDFHIFWDNAYVVHDLYGEGDKLLNLYDECVKCGSEDMPIMFASTSKVTFPGAGVAVEAGSPNTIKMLKSRIKFQCIGPDKINQLRHARMLPNVDAVKAQMKKHAEIIRPKFDAVLCELNQTVKDTGIAHWETPKGGYFISLYVMENTAKRVEELCKNVGLTLTPAGASYPYGKDPSDSNLRIAPTLPSVDDIKTAAKVLSIAVRYAALEKMV